MLVAAVDKVCAQLNSGVSGSCCGSSLEKQHPFLDFTKMSFEL